MTWRPFALALVTVLLPAAFLLSYQQHFGYAAFIIPAGLLLFLIGLALVVAATLLTLALIGRPAERTRRISVAAGVAGAYFAAIALIYAGSFVSNALWGDALNYQLLATFAGHGSSAFGFLPISETWLATVITLIKTGVVVAFVAITATTAWLLRPAIDHADSLFQRGLRTSRTRAPMAASLAAIGVGTAMLANQFSTAPHKLRGEPLSSFLMLVSAGKMLEMDNARWVAALADQAAASQYKPPTTPSNKNVILIMSDAMRADRMGLYGYHRQTTPFLSELHATGKLHRVDMALSTCSESFCGIASTLASRPYHELSMLNFKLNTVLKKAGYKVRYFLTGDHRSWPYLWDFYGSDIDQLTDYQTLRLRDMHDDRYIVTAASQIEAFSGQPNFMYFFLMSTHLVGTRIQQMQQFQPAHSDALRLLTFWNEMAGNMRDGDKVTGGHRLSSTELEAISNRYDNGILQVDFHLRILFRILAQKGYLKDSIVVIMGDHGEGLGERGYVGHSRTLYQDTIRIPLLIYDDEGARYQNSTFAVQPDVAPTIAERLGLPIPSSWQGRSLLQPAADRITYHQTRRGRSPCFAVVEHAATRLVKYLRCGRDDGSFREEVYDLVSDPAETQNVLGSIDPATLGRLRRADARRARLLSSSCDATECVD